MSVRSTFALAGTSLALVAAPAAVAQASPAVPASAGPAVTVRVEGVNHVLLKPTTVHAPTSGSITTGGTPAGACPAASAAGALNVATHHRWKGTYSSGLGIEITQILGETDKYTPHGHYWGIYVDNAFASKGICDLKLKPGEQLLFAAVPATGTVTPLGLTGPSKVTAGRIFTLKVVAYNAKGKAKPVAGVKVSGAAKPSNAHGLVTVTEARRGTAHFTAFGKGFVRSAPLAVKVG
ncbi:MAG TPA: hypothetical protein VFN55_06225 [Solirubrobacteraceae bacterium]|nr:hypothetical protein [Solirubrobacteraceae bacterium]